MKGQVKIDEFAFILLAGVIFILILAIVWTTPLEAPPSVEPTSIYLIVPVNGSKIFELNVSGKLTNVTLKATGEVADWIRFTKNNFDVLNYEIVPCIVSVPNVSLRTYSGKIIVSSTGGKKEIEISVDVRNITLPLLSRSLLFGVPDFTLTYAEAKTLDSRENEEIARSYFYEKALTLTGSLGDEELALATGGYIRIFISETNLVGNLIVIFNDQEIFNKKVGAGLVEVFINKSLIQKNNVAVIKADSPGWKFWATNLYKIKKAEISIVFEKGKEKTFTFTLEPREVDNFAYFLLSFYTPKFIPEISISINRQIVFLGKPPITFFNLNFSKDILGNSLFLAKGENTITFELRKEGSYEIRNLNFIVFYS
jgi:hypothetical protein